MTALIALPAHIGHRFSWRAALLATASAAAFVTTTFAQDVYAPVTLDFNDLGPSPVGTHMPASYGGLNWGTSDWHYMTLALAPTDDFLALSGTATGVVGTGGQDFYFDGADFWSRRGLDANGRFYFVLHLDGVRVYNGLDDQDGRQVFTAAHQLFTANYTGLVDHVAIAFDQGGDDWDHLAMDNVQLRTLVATPEPGTTSLLLLSTLALGFRRTRRQARRQPLSRGTALASLMALGFVFAPRLASATTITGNFDPTGNALLSRLLESSGIDSSDISNFEFVGNTVGFAQSGLFDSLTLRGAGNTSITLGSGIVLSSGSVTSLPTTNTQGSYSNITNTGGNNYFRDFPAQTGSSRHGGRLDERDENSLVFDFDAPSNATALRAQFVYASEEFPEWSGTGFADGFAFFVDGVNYAKLPDGRPVSLLREEDNIHFMINGDAFDPSVPLVADLEYDGITRILTLTVALNPGQRNSIEIVVGDTGDEIYDSAVFLSSFELLTGVLPDPTPDDPDDHPSPYDIYQRSLPQDANFVEFSSVPEPGVAPLLTLATAALGLTRRHRSR